MLSTRLDRYYGRLRLPPGATPTSRLLTGYRTGPSTDTAARFGRGGSPQFPPSPSERSAPHTPDSPSRLHLQGLHRFHGLHRDYRGSALSCPLTTRQASLHATDRSVPVVVGLVRPVHRNTEILGLILGELGQLDPQRIEVQPGHLFVQVLGRVYTPSGYWSGLPKSSI